MLRPASRQCAAIYAPLLGMAATLSGCAAGTQVAGPQVAGIQLEATGSDPLLEQFRAPPDAARPRVWWHWLNGNISEDGIVKDLEWMKRVGLGGVQNFDGNLMTPQIVSSRIAYMTPAWARAFRVATQTANRLGLEFAIASSPGWSETGGPWVPPADGMKKLVWSETDVVGGRPFTGRLTQPPATTGPFQRIPYRDLIAGPKPTIGGTTAEFYSDVAVLAYPLTQAATLPLPIARSGTTVLDAAALADDRPETRIAVPRGNNLRLDYAAPVTIRSATLFLPGGVPPFGEPEVLPVLEAQIGGEWRRIAAMPLGDVPVTVGFAPVTASTFRLTFGPNTLPKRPRLSPPAPGAVVAGIFPSASTPAAIEVAQLQLSETEKVDRFEAKAGYTTAIDYQSLDAGLPEVAGVDPARVIDLTTRMTPDGRLRWTPPAGRWRIVRLGSSLLGTTNHPASPEATGLEVDKYDGAAVQRYLDAYLANYRRTAGADVIGPRGVTALLTDSFEAGRSNWTPRLIEQFRQLRGYDPTPWLPALTGAVVGSRARSDAFLYDYRRTLADLLATEHYGTVARIAHENGLIVYGEALEDGRPALGDDMAMRRHADVPMAAMWAFPRGGTPRPTLIGDVRGAASVAHVYGRNLVAAESFTSSFAPWAFAPRDLKHIADLEFTLGVNRPIIHTSVHQPVDDKQPGLSLAIFGQYFNRHESWAEMARPWIDYLARSSFLLQQGRHHADVAWFYGEDAPLSALYTFAPLAGTPTRYGFDFINADVVLNELAVSDGMLTSKGGARYRALYLGGGSVRMTLPVLRRLAALVEGGMTLIGKAPLASPSLADDPAEFDRWKKRLWPGGGVTPVGQGRVIADEAVEPGLVTAGVAPDFDYVKPAPDSNIPFMHRTLPDGDIYYLSNQRDRAERIEARFRVTGKAPEIWRADRGSAEAVSFRIEGEHTIVPIDLGPGDAVFVLFRRTAQTAAVTLALPPAETAIPVTGAWTVRFQPGRGAAAETRMAALTPLDASTDAGIRYFSGIATYTTQVRLPRARVRGTVALDLGQVGDMAEVRVNDQLIGTAWRAPYRLDLGKAMRAGVNRIEVRVANLWVNRLIGDAQPGAAKITWISLPTYKPDAPLRPSGLIGPVRLISTGER